MREIEFRGKRIDNSEWVYGFLWVNRTATRETFYITDAMGEMFQVHPETIGQYTGLKDKNGKKIFEGDIVREQGTDYTPIYQNGIYMAYNVDKINDPYVSTQFNVIWRNGCEIIGNIHDTPDLLKVSP